MPVHEDSDTSIKGLRELVSDFVKERDWEQYHTPKSLAIAISIESAELLEHFLFKQEETLALDDPKFDHFTEEMADIFIYLMSLSNNLEIENFSEIIFQKMEKNKKKYPSDQFSGTNYRKQ